MQIRIDRGRERGNLTDDPVNHRWNGFARKRTGANALTRKFARARLRLLGFGLVGADTALDGFLETWCRTPIWINSRTREIASSALVCASTSLAACPGSTSNVRPPTRTVTAPRVRPCAYCAPGIAVIRCRVRDRIVSTAGTAAISPTTETIARLIRPILVLEALAFVVGQQLLQLAAQREELAVKCVLPSRFGLLLVPRRFRRLGGAPFRVAERREKKRCASWRMKRCRS